MLGQVADIWPARPYSQLLRTWFNYYQLLYYCRQAGHMSSCCIFQLCFVLYKQKQFVRHRSRSLFSWSNFGQCSRFRYITNCSFAIACSFAPHFAHTCHKLLLFQGEQLDLNIHLHANKHARTSRELSLTLRQDQSRKSNKQTRLIASCSPPLIELQSVCRMTTH